MKNLTANRLRGSLLRCFLLTGLGCKHTAELLTDLIRIPNIVVSSDKNVWIPRGLRDHSETTLVDTTEFLPPEKCEELIKWWLDKPRGANLPN